MEDEFESFENEGILSKYFHPVLRVFENYGWYFLIGAVAFVILYHKYIKSYVDKYRAYKFEKEYAAKYHKNPDVFAHHATSQQQWIEKMQAKYNKEAEEHEKKMKEREEKKKEELMKKHNLSGGHVLGDGKNERSNGFKQDYNPLMGSGSSSNYRPPRRSPCGGGGCGR